MLKKLLFVLLALFLFLKTSVPARAQTAWSDSRQISDGLNTAIVPSVTTDSKGYLHAVWMEIDPLIEDWWDGNENPGIFYSKWNGDTWSTPLRISANTGKSAAMPAIAAGSNNTLFAVWDEQYYNVTGNPEGQIMFSTSLDGGNTWSSPDGTISDATEGTDLWNFSPRIAVDSNNIVHVIYNKTQYGVYPQRNEYYYNRKNGTWAGAVKISENFVNAQHASLAVGPGSTVNVALWTETGKLYKKNSGVSWDPAVMIRDVVQGDNFRYPQYPKLIVDGNGRQHVVWGELVGGNFLAQYSTSLTGAAGTWTNPVTLNTANIEWTSWGVPLLGLTKDSKNNVYVGWGEIDNINGGIDVVYRRCGSNCQTDINWLAARELRNVQEVDSPYLYQDIWDNQHFIWTEKNQGTGKWEIWYSIAPTFWQTVGTGGNAGNLLIVNPNNLTMVTLLVPSGAITSGTVNFSVAIGPIPESANPNYVTIPRSYYFGPSGTNFAKALTAVYYYSDAEIIGSDERQLGVYVWDGQASAWTFKTGRVTTSQNKLTSDLTHFSLRGVRAPKVNLEFLSPTGTVTGTNIPVSFNLTTFDEFGNVIAVPPVVTTLDDPLPGDNVNLLIKDANSNIVKKVYSDAVMDGEFSYNGFNYSVPVPAEGLAPGDYSLEVNIGGTFIGSQQIHYTPAPPVTVEYLPPISIADLYTMNDGSTLPLKFQLKQENQVLLEQKQVLVTVDSISQEFVLGEGSSNIRFDPATGQYILNLHTKELGLTVGKYTISVLLDGQSLGTIQFELVEGGKSKGQSK